MMDKKTTAVLLVLVVIAGLAYMQYGETLLNDTETVQAEQISIELQEMTQTNQDILITLKNTGETSYNITENYRLDISIPGHDRLPAEDAAAFGKFQRIEETCFQNTNLLETNDFNPQNEPFPPQTQLTCNLENIGTLTEDQEATFHLIYTPENKQVLSIECSSDSNTAC